MNASISVVFVQVSCCIALSLSEGFPYILSDLILEELHVLRENGESAPVFMEGAEWIHILLLLTATAFMAVYCVKLYREWKPADFCQSAAQPAKQRVKGGK